MESRELLEQSIQQAWPTKRWANVTVLIAVSGGADSVALLRLLARVRPANSRGKLLVGHFNHKLRGGESDEDERFVQHLAKSLGLTCLTVAGNPPDPTKFSENDARDARYAFLQRTAADFGARYIVLAHTADDQAETILFRALRGTGITGLAGMPTVRPLTAAVSLIRPLLCVRRAVLRDYLTSLGQSFREDSSNADLRFARNRLRGEVIPRLAREYDPAIVETLLKLGEQAAELADEARRAAELAIERAVEFEANGFRLFCERLPHLSRQEMRRDVRSTLAAIRLAARRYGICGLG